MIAFAFSVALQHHFVSRVLERSEKKTLYCGFNNLDYLKIMLGYTTILQIDKHDTKDAERFFALIRT